MVANASRSLRRLLESDSAATAVEYGLIAGLVALATVGGLTRIGANLSAVLAKLAGYL